MRSMHTILSRARRRYRLQRLLQTLGWSLALGALTALLLVLAGRLLGISWHPWIPAGLVLSALAAALVGGLWKSPSDAVLASIIDDRLHLQDRLATALHVEHLEDPFARQVREEARQVGLGLSWRQAMPYRLTRPWGWVGPLLASALAIHLLLPHDLLGLGESRARQENLAQREKETAAQVQEELARTVEVLRQVQAAQETPAELEESLRGLSEIMRKELALPPSRQEAAVRLSEIQEKLAHQAQQRQETVQTMQSALSRLDAGQPGPADRFAQAMQRGDFAAAVQELESLSRALDELSLEDRQALRQQLENLAGQLAQIAQTQALQQAQAREQLRQTLQNAGLSEQQQEQIQQQLQQGASPQQIAQQLQQQGLSQPQSQQLAQQLSQQHQQSQKGSQCQGGSQQMSQALQQMAQSAGQQGQQGQAGQNSPWQQGQGQMGQQLSQLAQMQQQLQQMQQAQSQMQQAMQSLAQNRGAGQESMPWIDPRNRSPRTGGGGRGIGDQPGGDPMGDQRQLDGYQTDARRETLQGQGRVIASWLSQEENVAGPAQVEFNTALREARGDAERAIAEDRVPGRYHQTIKQYFNQLPQNPQEIRQSPPPPPG